jgi:glyoxylase-like metal-dependent hydrolase (beta-lactamase superfamily II)
MRCLLRLATLILFFVSATITAAQVAAPPSGKLPFELKLIGPNIWAALDDANGDAGANAGFVIGDSGVLVVDTFENEAAAKALLVEIQKLSHLPVKFVVNTHYHLDHVAGNRVFSNAGAVIVAHRSVRAWINTENLKFFGDQIKPEEKSFVEHLLGPEVTYESELSLFLGSRRIDVKFFEGHTGGDSVVSIPDAGIVFCGDLFWRKTLPNLIDATTAAWIASLDDIPSIPVERAADGPATHAAIFVPGHGSVGTAADVQDFQKYLQYLRSITQQPVDTGKTGDDLVSAVLPQLRTAYGSWYFFKDFSRTNILDAAAELNGSKRTPPRVKR